MERLANSPFSRVIVTDTIPMSAGCGPLADKLVELSTSELLGEAIRRIHDNESVSALFRGSALKDEAVPRNAQTAITGRTRYRPRRTDA